MTAHNGRQDKDGSSLQELVAAKKAELEAQLRALNTLDIEALLREREETAARLSELDAQIARVRTQLGVPDPRGMIVPDRSVPENGSRPPAGEVARARMSSDEVNRRILSVLEEDKSGLSQLQVAERAALSYGTVAAYLKTNAGRFQVTGYLKGKRYFLK